MTGVQTCALPIWLRLFGKDFFYIKHIGFDVSVFDDRARANAYLRVKKQEYIDGIKYHYFKV